MPARYLATCAFCLEAVDTRAGRGAYREVRGWEPIRRGGGGNTVALPQRTGQFAHKTCVEVEKVRPVSWTQLEMEGL